MTLRPFSPRPAVVPGDREHDLLRRVLRVDVAERFIARVVLLEESARYVSLSDSGDGSDMAIAGRDLALHLLWARDEANAWIDVGGKGALPVAPGDTLTLASGTPFRVGPGLLLAEIGGPLASAPRPGAVVGPTHGIERFDGYNRQTLCASTPDFSLERWKVTQPLALRGDAAIVNLVQPMALSWPGGTDLLRRGELRVIPSLLDRVTLYPDGLGYALVIRPDAGLVDVDALRQVTLP
jgi:hypothetical protein